MSPVPLSDLYLGHRFVLFDYEEKPTVYIIMRKESHWVTAKVVRVGSYAGPVEVGDLEFFMDDYEVYPR